MNPELQTPLAADASAHLSSHPYNLADQESYADGVYDAMPAARVDREDEKARFRHDVLGVVRALDGAIGYDYLIDAVLHGAVDTLTHILARLEGHPDA